VSVKVTRGVLPKRYDTMSMNKRLEKTRLQPSRAPLLVTPSSLKSGAIMLPLWSWTLGHSFYGDNLYSYTTAVTGKTTIIG